MSRLDPARRPRRIVVLATGGTIAAARGATGALAPSRDATELLAAVESPPGVHVESHQVLSVDSAAMSPPQMAEIAALSAKEARSGADGVVILHGTDTMEGTALLTDLRLADLYPQARQAGGRVVFTGAQRGADHPEPDGPANLRLALAAAALPAEHGLPLPDAASVAIAFGGTLLPVWGTRKVHTESSSGFAAWPDAAAARRLRERAVAELTWLRQRPGGTPAPVPAPAPPRVDVIALYPGSDATAFGAFRAAGARGLVLEALGAGNGNPEIVAAVRGLRAAGIPVVVTTRVPHGPVYAGYGGGGGGADLVAAGAVLSPVLRAGQARILLAELLRAGAERATVARVFAP